MPPKKKTAVKKAVIKKKTTRKKHTKSTAVQTEIILKSVIELVAQMRPRRHIVQYVSEKWGLSERQVDNYLKKAYTAIRTALPDVQTSTAIAIEMINDFKVRAKKAQKWIPEMMAIKEISKILVPIKHHIAGDPNGVPIPHEIVQPIPPATPEVIAEAHQALVAAGVINADGTMPEKLETEEE